MQQSSKACILHQTASEQICLPAHCVAGNTTSGKKKTQNICTNHTIKLFWHLFTTSLLVLLSGYYVWQQQK